MSSAETAFPGSNYQFDPSNVHTMAFESDPDQHTLDNSSIMWGGMQQLALDHAMSQKWPQGAEQYMFEQPAPVTHIGQYGQITPPNDDSLFFPSSKQEGAPAKNIGMGPGQPQGTPPAASTRSKRSRTSAKLSDKKDDDDVADRAPAEKQHQHKKKTTTRKARKGYKATTKEEEENDSEGEMKRERFLERNRVAASKCREKKKQWTNGLEAHARELAAANAQLNGCVLSLREQVLNLKSECLRHTDCDCSPIRDYLNHSIAGMNLSGLMHQQQQQQQRSASLSSSAAAAAATAGGRYRGERHGSAAGFSHGSPPTTDATSVTDESWLGPADAEMDAQAGGDFGAGQSRADRGIQELLGGASSSSTSPDSHMGESMSNS